MTHPTLEPPSTQQELERKAVDFMTSTLELLNAGRISNETAVVRAACCYDLISGLVDSEIAHLASQVASEVKAKAEQKSMYFRHPNGALLRVRYPTEGRGMVIRSWHPGKPESTTQQLDAEDHVERTERLKTLAAHLLKSGYELV